MARHHDRALQERRDREYQATRNASELAELERKWAREDAASEAAASWRTTEVLELQRRLAALERTLGADGKRLVNSLVKAIGDALRKVREEERKHTDEAIAAAFNERCVLDYRGVWDDRVSYSKGAAVTVGGSLFIAVAPAEPGERPGKGISWRLAVKSGQKYDPACA